MVVYALELHLHPVYGKGGARIDGIGDKAHRLADDFAPVFKNQGIELRVLRVPEDGVFHGEFQGVFPGFPVQQAILRVIEGNLCLTLHGNADDIPLRPDVNVPDMALGPGQQVHIPEDAVHPEKVLVFQVAAAAPLAHLGGDGIFSGLYKIRDVKLCLQVASLGVPGVAAVDVQLHAGGNPLKHDVVAAARIRNGKCPRVHAHGVFVGHIGRVHRIGVDHIGVVRLFIAPALPAGGHVNGTGGGGDLVKVPGIE